MAICKNCDPFKPCYIPDSYPVYGVDEFGSVKGEANMMQEIFQRGPITCGVDVNDNFENYKGGILVDRSMDKDLNHAISVTGWGEEIVDGKM
jgi:cathepsin X